jgi:hypothetical protein
MINNPVHIEIAFAYGMYGAIEVVPIYEDNGSAFLPTGVYQLYEGCQPESYESEIDLILNEKYLESIDLMGANHPGFLGELQFTGYRLFEWKYIGYYLTEGEVYQVVTALQDFDSDAVLDR